MSSNFANGANAKVIEVVALARVSTERQNVLSPRMQIDRIKAWCKAMGYEVIAEMSDAMSGTRADRAGLEAAVAMVCARKCLLVTYDIERLFRDSRHMLNTLHLLKENGAAYCCVTNAIFDTRDGSAFAECARTIFAAVGQMFAAQTGEKVALQNWATVKERVSEQWPKGYRTNGPQPVGWKLDENGYRIPCELELDAIAQAKQALAEVGGKPDAGMWARTTGRWARAARLLNDRGVPTISEIRARRNNRENRSATKWTVKAVQRATMDEGKRMRELERKRKNDRKSRKSVGLEVA